MYRTLTLDCNDVVIAEGEIRLTPQQMNAGYWFVKLHRSHEDYAARVGERIIP